VTISKQIDTIMHESVIRLCEQLIRDLTNDIVGSVKGKPFRETVIKKLKFSKPDDWNILCSLMDVLGDTELAKENFVKFDLSGPTRILDYGEQYLRLYGIVNAIYLQRSAILSLVELVKLKDKKKIVKKLDGLKLLEFRHIAGAHTTDFLDNGVINPHQIQRGFGQDVKIRTRDSKGIFKDYDLKAMLNDYNAFARELMIQAAEKFLGAVLPSTGRKQEQFTKRLMAIKAKSKGAFVFSVDERADKNELID